jgi:hypothetical protein
VDSSDDEDGCDDGFVEEDAIVVETGEEEVELGFGSAGSGFLCSVKEIGCATMP